MGSLSDSEVRNRLETCNDKVANELYAFGKELINDAVDRLAKSDSKAAALAAYGAGIITIVVSTSNVWGKFLNEYFALALVVGVVAFIVSAAFAIRSIYPQATLWYSENDWLRSDCLQDDSLLRRYRIFTMWTILTSHHGTLRKKIGLIHWSVRLMAVGFALLSAALLQITWRYAALQHLGIWVR